MVLSDQAVDNSAMCGQSSDCRLFILPHEAAIAVDVGAEDSSELAFHLTCRRIILPSTMIVK
jgi:hypothetical protein